MGYFSLGNQPSSIPIPISKWQGKKWYVFGDSNSAEQNGTKAYHSVIAKQINCFVSKFAYGGAGYVAKGSTGTYPKIMEQIAQADGNADLITVLAGGNDYAVGTPLGNIGNGDNTTFYGAVEEVITTLIAKYPTKTIAVFTQFRREVETANSAGVTVKQQVDATLEVCGKYAIPCFDLYRNSNIYPWNSVYKSTYMLDSVHLNNLGQEKLAPKILNRLETL